MFIYIQNTLYDNIEIYDYVIFSLIVIIIVFIKKRIRNLIQYVYVSCLFLMFFFVPLLKYIKKKNIYTYKYLKVSRFLYVLTLTS